MATNRSFIDTDLSYWTFEEIMGAEIYSNFINCNETVLQNSYPTDGQTYCNATFDGYTCWNYTLAGTRAFGYCPYFMIYSFGQQEGLPFKDCSADGTWFKHPLTKHEWTDYSPCSHTENVKRAVTVIYVYLCGYVLSILSLVVALSIFLCCRKLSCIRITIHTHLFLSYLLTAALWISYYSSSLFNFHVLEQNPIWCRVLHVMAQYVTVCNYAWMFCEGFYLHTLLVVTFIVKNTLLRICYIIGWGLPIIPCIIYSVLRSLDINKDKSCWHENVNLIWILSGPISLSLIINLFFLANILRIVCYNAKTKTRRNESQPLRQSLRATCILVPLFGVQYIALPFRPSEEYETGQFVYDVVSAFLSSFQGFLVSVLFCFLNKDVIAHFKAALRNLKNKEGKGSQQMCLYSRGPPSSNSRYLLKERFSYNARKIQTTDCNKTCSIEAENGS